MAQKRTIADLKRHHSVGEVTARRLMLGVERIESQPDRYDQQNFGYPHFFDFEKHEVTCGSSCCLAAHIVAMFGGNDLKSLRGYEIQSEALQLLDCSLGYAGSQLAYLFDGPEDWPQEFRDPHGEVTPEHLRRRVELFIETGDAFPQ